MCVCTYVSVYVYACVRAACACGQRDRGVRGSLADCTTDYSGFGGRTRVSFPDKTVAFLARNL